MKTTENGRRNFLGLLGAGGLATALLGAGRAQAQGKDEPKRDEPPDGDGENYAAKRGRGKTYRGTSRKGDFQEALEQAIAAALKAAPGADRQVRWALRTTSGVAGGISPQSAVTVTIEAWS